MPAALVATRDLMTASRFTTTEGGPEVIHCRTDEALAAALERHPRALLVVDLTAFAELGPDLRDRMGAAGRIVGFAPHVQEELLAEAGNWCDEVLPRGAAIKRFPEMARVYSGPETDSQ